MVIHDFKLFFVFLFISILVPSLICAKTGISFSYGYGFPLPFEYAGNTFSGTSSYKEDWTSFGNGSKLNLKIHFPLTSTISITSGVEGTVFGSHILPKSSGTYHYHDKFSQTLGGLYGGLETVGFIRRWILSVSLEPGIYYPYNVTVLRQQRIEDSYSNGQPFGDVISDMYRCYYHPSFGISGSLRFGYKTSRNYLLFLSVRPTIIRAHLKGYEKNINGKKEYHTIKNNYMVPFAYQSYSEIRESFPIDFSSVTMSAGIEFYLKE